MIGTGDGGYHALTWSSGTTFTVGPKVLLGGPVFTSLVTGDFNRDGETDLAGIVAQSGFPSRVALLLGVGNATFGSVILVPLASDLGAATLLHLRAGDFDGDGLDDLAFVAPAAHRTAILQGVAAGAHDTLGVADVDGDGDLDLLIGNATTLEIRVLLNDIPWAGAAWRPTASATSPGHSRRRRGLTAEASLRDGARERSVPPRRADAVGSAPPDRTMSAPRLARGPANSSIPT